VPNLLFPHYPFTHFHVSHFQRPRVILR